MANNLAFAGKRQHFATGGEIHSVLGKIVASEKTPPKMIVCHMNKEEAEDLAQLQGGLSYRKVGKRNLLEFSRISVFVDIPEFREVVSKIWHSEDKESKTKIDRERRKVSKLKTPYEKVSKLTPEEISAKGRNGDNTLVLLPENFIRFLIKLMGYPPLNEETGLFEFKSFRKRFKKFFQHLEPKNILKTVTNTVLPVVSTVVGTAIAGPIGGVAGAGIGRTVGGVLSGQNLKDSLKAGFRNTARAGGFMLGATTGMPILAPIGASIGGMGARAAQGAKGSGLLKEGMRTFGATSLGMGFNPAAIAQGGLQGLPTAIMNHPSAFMEAVRNPLGGATNSWFGGGAGAAGSSSLNAAGSGAGASSMPNAFTNALGSSGASSLGSTAATTAAEASPWAFGLKDALSLAPVGLMGGALMMSNKQQKKEQKQYEEAKEEQENRPYVQEQLTKNYFKNTDYDPNKEKKKASIYDWEEGPSLFDNIIENDVKRKRKIWENSGAKVTRARRNPYSYLYYASGGDVHSNDKGTLLVGPGKGQADKIKTSVPEGSHIIDASTTSMLGDGSTVAGANVLKQFERQVQRGVGKHKLSEVKSHVRRHTRPVPVWLSDGEYKFDPTTVTLLGNGSNKAGSRKLEKMVKNVRHHKNSNGTGLPPKAKLPIDYV
jgi:hypothetical protein